MKAFVACRVSGEDKDDLLKFLSQLKTVLVTQGIQPYITELMPPQPDDDKKLVRAFQHIEESNVLIVIYKPGPASEGMSAEIGYAYGRKTIWIFAQEGSDSKLFAFADELTFWQNEADLFQEMRKIDISQAIGSG